MVLSQQLCSVTTADFFGYCIGIISFTIAVFFSFLLFQANHLNHKKIIFILCASTIGHVAGAYALYWFAINIGADSCFYFQNGILEFQGLGYWFAFFAIGYLKEYLMGESFLGAFYFSGALALISSVYLALTYKALLDKISKPHCLYILDTSQLYIPLFFLLCWPSYFFWSAGLVKDNFALLGISIFLFNIARGKVTVFSALPLFIAGLLALMGRPYLLFIFSGSAAIYVLHGKKVNFIGKIIMCAILAFALLFILPLTEFSRILTFSIYETGTYAIKQQEYMSIGSSIPVPTHNPYLAYFFLPYLLLVNLFLPLGIGARSFIGIISSFENALLLALIVFFIRNKKIWNSLLFECPILKFYFIYFLFGMSCLSIVCTNFGLAMREKMMYVPSLLICIFMTYAYKRILLIRYSQELEKTQQLTDSPS